MLLSRIFQFLAPYDCLLCGREGKLLCAWCRPDAFEPLPSRCFKCHKLTADFRVCSGCCKQTVLTHVWVGTWYRGIARELVRRYKFERAQSAAGVLADILCETLPFPGDDKIISFIPTATSRVRERGYDHALVLARAYARSQGMRPACLLARLGQARQVGAVKKIRKEQMKQAFQAKGGANIKGKHILLIDDIVTTGATLDAAARVLKAAGAKSVSALVVAQKQ